MYTKPPKIYPPNPYQMVIAAQYLMKLKMKILKATRAVFSKFEISGNNKRMNHIKQKQP
jgi:hypothetical protein